MMFLKSNFTKDFFISLFFLLSTLSSKSQSIVDKSNEISFEEIVIPFDNGLQSWENIDVFFEDQQGIIWTLIEDGLYRYNGHTAINITNYLSQFYHLDIGEHSATRFLIQDSQIIWYGTRKGLYKIDIKNKTFKNIFLDEPLHKPNWRNFILELKAHDNILYVGTSNGLYLVDMNTNVVVKKYLTNGIDIHHRNSSHAVESLFVDSENNLIWVAMPDGFYKIDISNDSIAQYQIKDAPYIYPHNFHEIAKYEDLFLMPSHGLGMVAFDIKTTQFSYYGTIPTQEKWDRVPNIIRSALPLNDSISLVNAVKLGNGLYNRKTNNYQWLTTPEPMKEGVFLNLDNNGFVWASKRGRIFRSTNPILKDFSSINHTIDISSIVSNKVLKSRPFIDGDSSLILEKEDKDLTVTFSITKPHLWDTIHYEYRFNTKRWLPVKTPNSIRLSNFLSGKNELDLRALHKDGTILATKKLLFSTPIPFYKQVYFVLLFSILGLGFPFYLIWRSKYLKDQKELAESSQKAPSHINLILDKIHVNNNAVIEKPFLNKVQQILNAKLSDSSFSANDFSHELGMSRMQLHRKLKTLTGMSTSEFIRYQRLQLASSLLKKTDVNISQVSYSVGFNDHAYFSKCFKEMFHCTPSEYSKKHRLLFNSPHA